MKTSTHHKKAKKSTPDAVAAMAVNSGAPVRRMFYGISGGSIIIHRNGDMDAAREMALKIAKDIKKRKSVKGAEGSLELLDEMRNRVA